MSDVDPRRPCRGFVECPECDGSGVVAADCAVCGGAGFLAAPPSVHNIVVGSVRGTVIQTSGDVTAPIVFGGAA
ncbi:hypothetical protein UA75_02805 [Actinoalloteichus sp. GBA129-24]|nr:hypothetical protein UA75_02805 [Actinoalloteichus sp. GBA129-24]